MARKLAIILLKTMLFFKNFFSFFLNIAPELVDEFAFIEWIFDFMFCYILKKWDTVKINKNIYIKHKNFSNIIIIKKKKIISKSVKRHN